MTVFFVHVGRFSGLRYAIESVRHWNPSMRIVAISDLDYLDGYGEPHPISDYSALKNQLDSYYVHNHHLSERFEKLCISRWFVIHEFVKKNDVSGPIITPDWDYLTFCDLTKEFEPYLGCDFAVSKPLGYPQAPLLINNLSVLEEFSEWAPDRLSRDDMKTPDPARAVCDMWLWKEFTKEVGHSPGDVSNIINGSTFDHNLCMDYHGYEHDGNTKVVRFRNGQPFCNQPETGREVRFNMLHCWGMWKDRMKELWDKSRSNDICQSDSNP